jgi:hypothetical protein
MDRVQYLGYNVDEDGMHVDPSKIHVIRVCLSPTTLTEVHRFLNLANFCCRFMLGFSHITWVLNQVTRGGGKEKFMWGISQQQVFDDLNKFLCLTLVISLPDLQQPFEIEINDLDYVVGTVLIQHRHPLAYHSETLLDAIHKYPNYDKKCTPL